MIDTALYINGQQVDLEGDEQILVTSSMADVRDPGLRQGDYTKTIRIPGTSRNNKLFTHIWDIGYAIQTSGVTNFTPDFNPNLKATALLTREEIPQLKGHARLLSITVIDEDEIYYEVTLVGRAVSLFVDVGEGLLEDIDLSAHNHTYSYTSIVNSWSAAVGSGYVYPMVDYGLNDLTRWKIEDFLPAIYIKTLVDEIFSSAGWTYSSSFFDSDRFKRLVMLSGSDKIKLTDNQISSRTFFLANNGTQSFSWDDDLIDYADFPADAFSVKMSYSTNPPTYTDPGSNWSGSDFSVPSKGVYDFEVNARVRVLHAPDNPAFLICNVLCQIELIRQRTDGSIQIVGSSGYKTIAEPGSTVTSGDRGDWFTFAPTFNGIALEKGDTVFLRPVRWAVAKVGNTWYADKNAFNHAAITGSPDLEFGAAEADNNFRCRVTQAQLKEGETMTLSNALPAKVKQRDLLTTLTRMFNLHYELDKDVDKKLLIEPRDDFFTSDVVDLSNVIDMDSPVTEIPMGDLDFKTFLFTYREDKDYFNEKYIQRTSEVYGSKRVEIENDFVRSEKKQELFFAPTPLASSTLNDRIISSIHTRDKNGAVAPFNGHPRILFYGGLLSTADPFHLVASSGVVSHSSYPYAGHLDDPIDPAFDLLFGAPREVYYRALKYTDGNLYNIYHRKQINEITDKDSKVVSAHFYLTPSLFYQIDFRKIYHFLGHNFRLNKIYDHDLTGVAHGLTRLEFTLLKSFTTFSATQSDTGGGPEDETPVIGTSLQPRDNLIPPYPWVTVQGEGNIVSERAVDVLMNCDHNRVLSDARSVTLLASSGNTVGGRNNLLLFTSGITLADDNQTYLMNQKIGRHSTLTSETFFVSSGDVRSSLPKTLIEAKGDGQVIDVITAISRFNEGVEGGYAWSGSLPYLGLRYSTGEAIGRFDAQWTAGAASYMKMQHDDAAEQKANTGVQLYSGGSFTDGDGYFKIEILYRIIEI